MSIIFLSLPNLIKNDFFFYPTFFFLTYLLLFFIDLTLTSAKTAFNKHYKYRTLLFIHQRDGNIQTRSTCNKTERKFYCMSGHPAIAYRHTIQRLSPFTPLSTWLTTPVFSALCADTWPDMLTSLISQVLPQASSTSSSCSGMTQVHLPPWKQKQQQGVTAWLDTK